MGTQQQLTTQQTELLIIIKEIEDFDKEQPGNIPLGGIGEIIVGNSIMTFEELEDARNILEYYGYLRNGYELTMDGRQYISLFQEHLQEQVEKLEELVKFYEVEESEEVKEIEVIEKLDVHNSIFSFNIDKFNFNIKINGIEVSGKILELVEKGKKLIDAIKAKIWK